MFFCFQQKTAYELRISDWSSDVCSSDLRPIVPLRLSREIEPKPLAIFILGELAVEAPSPQMGGVARAPVERGDASDAFALELIVGIFYLGRHPFARRAGERRPIVRHAAEALEIAFRIAAANQDTEFLVAAETAARARVPADRIILIRRLVSHIRIRHQ